MTTATATRAAASVGRRSRGLGKRLTLRLMVAPAVGWILVLSIFPMIYSLYIAFTSKRFGGTSRWVGFENFSRALSDERFLAALKFTALFVGAAVTIEMILGFILAVVLDSVTRGRGAVRTIWTMPLFSTPVAIAYLSLTMFNEGDGPINAGLKALGLGGVRWLSSEHAAPWTIILLDVWQWTPFVVLILFAALQSIPTELVEAARVDGAASRQIIRHLVLPMVVPALLTVLFLRVADAVKMFDFAFALTGGGPGTATEPASLYTYRQALDNFNLGYGSALAYVLLIIASVVGGLLLVLSRRVANKGAAA
jgi:multiple sugar transport system permease protein